MCSGHLQGEDLTLPGNPQFPITPLENIICQISELLLIVKISDIKKFSGVVSGWTRSVVDVIINYLEMGRVTILIAIRYVNKDFFREDSLTRY